MVICNVHSGFNDKLCLLFKLFEYDTCHQSVSYECVISSLYNSEALHVQGVERSGLVGRALDRESKDCLFEPHCRGSNCVVSFSKTLYSLLSTG